ncbi:MFS transporter [Gemella sp. zg-1178]|uniref:MFS transporter n=1 Tax=Gemella sp. zg-1178 TaxID=2840372 RepID=UPI001C042B37|nr:MFS transporter [Gemella sp. zg-1178]MBU0278615.1 MFS transporter [Gemella sp. zg-1178]
MNKNYLKELLLIGNGLGQIGSSVLSFALGLYIFKVLNSVFLYSLSQIIAPLVALLLLPILGSIVDKFNRNKIIKFSQFASCIALVLFYLLNGENEVNFANIVVLLIILKISDQFLSTTLTASTSSLINEKNIQSFRSHLQLIQAASMILSPIIAVFIYDKLSIAGAVIISAVIEFFVLIIFWNIDFKYNKIKNSTNNSLLFMFKEGMKFIFSYKKIIFGMLFVLVINFIVGVINVGLPYLQIQVLKFSNTAYAINDSIFAIGLILGALITTTINTSTKLRFARYSIILMGIVTLILSGLLGLDFSNNTWYFVIAMYSMSIALFMTIGNILLSSWSMIKIPKEFQGRVFAILNTVTQITMPLSILIYGYMFARLDAGIIFFVSAGMLLIVSIPIPGIFKINLANDELE